MSFKAVSTSMFRVVMLSLVFTSIASIFVAEQALDQREQFARDLKSAEVVPPSSKPAMTQESVEIALQLFDIKVPVNTLSPRLDVNLEDRGLTTLNGWGSKLVVTVGPAAFTSWALLGSTLAHELEVHCQQNFAIIRLKDMMGLNGTHEAEREAYMHELANSYRFRLKSADQLNIKATMEYYYPAVRPTDEGLSARR